MWQTRFVAEIRKRPDWGFNLLAEEIKLKFGPLEETIVRRHWDDINCFILGKEREVILYTPGIVLVLNYNIELKLYRRHILYHKGEGEENA